MTSEGSSVRILYGSLFALTFITGLVDAGSFVAMGHVFTANMTGNVVFMAFALGDVPGLSLKRSATALGFALLGGSMAGHLDRRLSNRQRNMWLAAALAIESLLLFAAIVPALYLQGLQDQDLPALYAVIALTAVGMGLRNGTIRRLAVPEMTTTVLTLTIAALAFDFSFKSDSNPHWCRRLGSILTMFLGAYSGVLLVHRSLALLLAVAATLTAACMAAQFCRQETFHETQIDKQAAPLGK